MFIEFLALVLVFSVGVAEDCHSVTDLSLILFKGSLDAVDIVFLNDTKSLLENPAYDNKKVTLIYCFGYTETYRHPSSQAIAKAYLTRKDTNIIIIDWSKYNNGNYFLDALPHLMKVGVIFGQALVKMAGEGFDVKNFHLIGHSLGCHVHGIAGRTAKAQNIIISRITGLDCAGPAFFPLNPFLIPLNAMDANFVDIIYTNSELLGATVPTGHANFFPNGGSTQPGCPPFNDSNQLSPDNFCSHWRSWMIYAESVVKQATKSAFSAISCDSWSDFTNHICKYFDIKKKAIMGYHADPKATGNFYLQTNSKSNFSRGSSGIWYTRG